MRLCRRGKGYVGIREAFCEENESSLVLSLLVLAILFSHMGVKGYYNRQLFYTASLQSIIVEWRSEE